MNNQSPNFEVCVSFTKRFTSSTEFVICTLKGSIMIDVNEIPFCFLIVFQQVPISLVGQNSQQKGFLSKKISTSSNEDYSLVKLRNPKKGGNFEDLLFQIEEGLKIHQPELCKEGINGTYFIKNVEGKIVGVFKPQDEEVQSENNPKLAKSKINKLGVFNCLQPGEASKREVAAYLIDREGFFEVPRTAIVEINHQNFSSTKTGSLQEFVENNGSSSEVGPSMFPVKEVHKIGILDLYIFNFDRHEGNILFKKDGEAFKLIPIDNGFSLPDRISISNHWFEWLNWPQAKKPFDKDTLAFIERLNPDKDIAMLKEELGIRPECLRIMKICAFLLKKCASAGLTLRDIALMICRSSPNEESPLENMAFNALKKLSFYGDLNMIHTLSEEKGDQFVEYCIDEMDQVIKSHL